MKKIYKYSKEQEKEINIELGYTEEQLDSAESMYEHYQLSLSDEQVYKYFEDRKKKKCSDCSTKLIWIKECSYIGLRHPGRATMGDMRRAYNVIYKRYCPKCEKIID